jgi:hypothetical protein
MPRLNVETAERWAGAEHAGFATSTIRVAMSMSDDQGLGVAGVPASAFHLRYLADPGFRESKPSTFCRRVRRSRRRWGDDGATARMTRASRGIVTRSRSKPHNAESEGACR